LVKNKEGIEHKSGVKGVYDFIIFAAATWICVGVILILDKRGYFDSKSNGGGGKKTHPPPHVN